MVIKPQENKGGREEKRPMKTNRIINKMAIGIYILIIDYMCQPKHKDRLGRYRNKTPEKEERAGQQMGPGHALTKPATPHPELCGVTISKDEIIPRLP